MTIIEKVLALVGPGADEKQIAALVEMCKEEAVQFCNLPEYTDKLDNAVVNMVIERFNRLSNEGIISTSASSVRERFIDGYSKNTLAALIKNRKIKVVH